VRSSLRWVRIQKMSSVFPVCFSRHHLVVTSICASRATIALLHYPVRASSPFVGHPLAVHKFAARFEPAPEMAASPCLARCPDSLTEACRHHLQLMDFAFVIA
jgi:hypothetical protein